MEIEKLIQSRKKQISAFARKTVAMKRALTVDENAVWSVVEKDIPELKFNIEAILKTLDE